MLKLFKRHTSNKVTFTNHSKGNAAYFRPGNQTYLVAESPIATAYPLTIAGWFNVLGSANAHSIFYVGDKASPTEFQGVYVRVDGPFSARSNNTTTSGQGLVSGTWNDGAWHFFAAVFTSNTSRHARLDSTVGSTNTTNVVITANYDRTALGSWLDSTPTYGEDVVIDDISVFNKVLTNDELTWLQTHASPSLYYDLLSQQGSANVPDTANLLAFWSLDERHGPRRDSSPSRLDVAMVRGTGLSNFNDTVIVYPGKRSVREVRIYQTANAGLGLTDAADWSRVVYPDHNLNLNQSLSSNFTFNKSIADTLNLTDDVAYGKGAIGESTLNLTDEAALTWEGEGQETLTLNQVADYVVEPLQDDTRAAIFDGSSFLQFPGTLKSNYPVSVCLFFKVSDISVPCGLFSVGEAASNVNFAALFVSNAAPDGGLVTMSRIGAAIGTAATTNNYADGNWHFGAGIFTSNTSRRVYVDGEAAVTNTANVVYPSVNVAHIGATGNGTVPNIATENTVIDNVIVYGMTLTANHVAWIRNSGNGRSLNDIQTSGDADNPGTTNLIAYYRLNTDLDATIGTDAFNGNDMTVNGTVLDTPGIGA